MRASGDVFPLKNCFMEKDDVTFCLWQEADETQWHRSPDANTLQQESSSDDGGQSFLLGYIFPSAEKFVDANQRSGNGWFGCCTYSI